MKDVNNLKGYRLKYKRYYDIDFGNDYEIHHLDLDHNNNDIDNLLLLPKELHRKYHFYLSATTTPIQEEKTKRVINVTLNGDPYNTKTMLYELFGVMKECEDWVAYKHQLELRRYYKNL